MFKPLPLLSLVCATLLSPPLLADEPLKRHGSVTETDKPMQVLGGFTGTFQTTSDSRIEDEGLVSFDLVATMRDGPGEWTAYIEGNLSPRVNGVSRTLVEVNGDAGTALDRDNKGRLQVSGLHYTFLSGANSMTMGLINPACVLDASAIANDETSQFLSSSFVNNPTIAFPDYALGTCMHFEASQTRPGINLLLSSSHGLADNPNRSYSELVDVTATGKGLFIGSELYWHMAADIWRIGIWTSTADHAALDGSGNNEHNYGAYLSTDHRFANSKINLRLGWANDKVSLATGFASLALETTLATHTLGAALGKTLVSDKAGSGSGDTLQAEVYVRIVLNDRLHLSPSLQYIENSGFDATASLHDQTITVYALRAGYAF